MAPQLRFDSCVLDVEVKNFGFVVSLIEINPWGAHAGSGSLLFHWLDDADILNHRGWDPEPAVVIRLVEEGESPVLSRDEAYRTGRERIIEDELRCLRERGMEWILGYDAHEKFMALSLPGAYFRPTTRKEGLEMFQRKRAGIDKTGDDERLAARDHPRLVKLRRASLQGID
ncbi:division cycle 123 protein [Colletotrichum asianum]